MTTSVDTPTAAATPSDDDDALEAIHQRLIAEQPRFLGAIDGGPEIYSPFALAQLVHEITAEARADTARALTGELREAGDDVRHVVDLLVASDERGDRLYEENERLRGDLDGLRGENDRLRAELAGRTESVWD